MLALFKRVSYALTLAALGLGGVPATLGVHAAQQVAAPVSVDCDSFADGQHEVPIVVVTKPSPGTTVPAGALTIQGAALDCHADVGTGINRVAVYLGRRETGGVHLGDAALRGPSPIQVLPADQYASVGWSLNASAPLKPGQVNELYVYARSELTNAESVVAVPIMGGGPAAEAAAAPSSPAPPPVPTASPAHGPAEMPANNIPTDLPQLPPQPDQPELGAGDVSADPPGEPPTE
jgi:hypothetical protein